jgi:dTDP-4-amino-4,6-dideoxygalactose transaminase
MSSSNIDRIPYVDIQRQHASMKAELMAAIGDVIDQGQFILGPQVAEFERQFAALCGAKFAVGVANGTDALVLALKALGIGPGDEVLTPPNSFIASTSCIRLVGATPVFVDVSDDLLIDPALIVSAITPRTKAILPVHLTGRACAMGPIMDIAREYGLKVVEDCAQAVLSECDGRRVGSFGDCGCFSLHPLKTLNACGDGGIITTSDANVFEQLRIARNIGLKTRDDCVFWSGNSRLDTMQAAILLVKLRHLEEWTRRRRENAAHYQKRLAAIPQIVTPHEAPGLKPAYHTFVVQARRRDELRKFLTENGIDTAIHYPVPIHLSTAGKELGYSTGDFPKTEAQAGKIVSLPIYPELTSAQIDRVCDTIQAFYSQSTPASEDPNASEFLVSGPAVR